MDTKTPTPTHAHTLTHPYTLTHIHILTLRLILSVPLACAPGRSGRILKVKHGASAQDRTWVGGSQDTPSEGLKGPDEAKTEGT